MAQQLENYLREPRWEPKRPSRSGPKCTICLQKPRCKIAIYKTRRLPHSRLLDNVIGDDLMDCYDLHEAFEFYNEAAPSADCYGNFARRERRLEKRERRRQWPSLLC
jgi:hypothetical protein